MSENEKMQETVKTTGSTKKRGKKNKKKSRIKKVIFWILGIILFGILLLCALFAWALLASEEVNESNFWKAKNTTTIYDRNDEYVTSIGSQNIRYVTLDEVSPYYTKGLVDTEDSRFYSHHGIDLIGMMRAVLQTIAGGNSGGSTITMQLAKNLYLSGSVRVDENGNQVLDENGYQIIDYPYSNKLEYKLKQMAYAVKIENQFTKEEILENYINYLQFDNNIIGVENASQYYFDKSSKDLTISEAATLAGMTQLPAEYNPYKNLEASMNRRNIVLKQLNNAGDITPEEYKAALEDDLAKQLASEDKKDYDKDYKILRPYLDVIESELYAEFGEDFDINNASLKIHTSLDMSMQKKIFNDVNNNDDSSPVNYIDNKIQAGAVLLDSQTGELLAINGGRLDSDGELPDQNYGASYIRQPGSTAKPLVDYAPAIEYLDWSTGHIMNDGYTTYSNGMEIKNADFSSEGNMTIQQALAKSKNTIALQTFKAVAYNTTGKTDIHTIENFMKSLGFTDSENVEESYAIGGWANGTTPLEMSAAYATLANGGVYNNPHAIKYVEFDSSSQYFDKYGEKYEFKQDKHTVMDERTAFMVTKMLYPGYSYALSNEMYTSAFEEEQAIKTGTSNWASNNYGIPDGMPRDKWVAGYTPDVTTVIWSGYDGSDEAKGKYFNDYGFWTYDLYKAIMTDVANSKSKYLNNDNWTQPSGLEQINGYYQKTGSNDIATVTTTSSKKSTTSTSSDKDTSASKDS